MVDILSQIGYIGNLEYCALFHPFFSFYGLKYMEPQTAERNKNNFVGFFILLCWYSLHVNFLSSKFCILYKLIYVQKM